MITDFLLPYEVNVYHSGQSCNIAMKTFILIGFPVFYFECILWKLFHKRIVRTKLDIYIFIKSLQSLYFLK